MEHRTEEGNPLLKLRSFIIKHILNTGTYNDTTNQTRICTSRWPYDMRPSVRAEKYIRDASG